MLTLFAVLAGASFGLTIWSAMGKGPLWPAVLMLSIIELLRVVPLGR